MTSLPDTVLKQNEPVRLAWVNRAYPVSGTFATTNTPVNVLIGTNNRTRTSVKNWRKIIASGGNASTAYNRDIYEAEIVLATTLMTSLTGSNKGDMWGYTGWPTAPPSFPVMPSDSALQDQAIAKVRARLNDKASLSQSIAPLVELRELRQVVRGVLNPTRTLLDTVSFILNTQRGRGRVPKPTFADMRRSAGDAWLTWNFGIRPMISDAQSIAKSIDTALTRSKDTNEVVHGSASKTWIVQQLKQSGSPFGNLTTSDIYWTQRNELSYHYTVGFRPNMGSATSYGRLADHLGLNPSDIVPAAWELIPFSWLADYFGTIGDSLSDTFQTAPSITYGTLATRFVCELTGIANIRSNSSGASCQVVSPGHITKRWIAYRRSLQSTWPVRSLRLRSPDEIASHGIQKILNLVSILQTSNRSLVHRVR